MRTMRRITICSAVALVAFLAPAARAQLTQAEARKLTYLTFSGPVQVPGVTLPAGTYKFQTVEPGDHIVQIFNKDGTEIYAMFLTLPNERPEPTDETVVMFAEAPPQAVKVWYYPGVTLGEEFVYPKSQAVQLAKANRTFVPAIEDSGKWRE